MSAVIVASVAGAAITGYLSSKSQTDSDRTKARSASNQLEFEQAKYDRWLDIYGDAEENAGEFYGSLSEETYVAQGMQQQQQEYQKAVTQMKERFAQSGVTGGAVADTESRMAIENAEARAEIRAEAPFKVAEAQASFAQGRQAPTQGISNAMADKTAIAGQADLVRASQYQGLSNTLAGVAGNRAVEMLDNRRANQQAPAASAAPSSTTPTETLR